MYQIENFLKIVQKKCAGPIVNVYYIPPLTIENIN